MPGGGPPPTGSLVLTGSNTSTVGLDGSFSGKSQTSGVHILSFTDAHGNLLMYGDSLADGTAAVDAKHTAATMLYLGLGLWQTPAADQQPIFTDLLRNPATTAFAITAAARLKADPNAIADRDAQLYAAETVAENTIAANGRTAPIRRMAPQSGVQSVDLLIQPPASSPQSGDTIEPDTDQQHANQLRVVNSFRRPIAYYIYHTDDVDANNAHHPIVPPKLIQGPVEIEGSEELSVVSTVRAVTGTGVPWLPRNGPFEMIPLAADMKKSIYKVVTIGPNLLTIDFGVPWNDPAYASFKPGWQTQFEDLDFVVFVNNYMLPLLSSFDLSPVSAIPDSEVEQFRKFFEEHEPAVNAAILTCDMKSAEKAFVEDMADNTNLELQFTAFAASVLGQRIPGNSWQLVIKGLSKAYLLIDGMLLRGDILKSTSDLAHSNISDGWDVTAAALAVQISPATAHLTPFFPSLDFKTTVANGANGLRYQWDAGALGTVDDHKGKSGDQINTDQAVVTFTANAPIPTSGTDVVSVTVFDEVGNEIGTVKAVITFEANPAPGQVYARVSSVDSSLSSLFKAHGFTGEQVGFLNWNPGPGQQSVGVTYDEAHGAEGLSLSLVAPNGFASGQSYPYGGNASGILNSLTLTIASAINGQVHIGDFVTKGSTGFIKVTAFDGNNLSFSTQGHLLLEQGEQGANGTAGANVDINGTVKIH